MDSAPPRTLDELLDFELPEDVWRNRDFTNIYCAVLFADLENSVQISRIISPEDYDELIDIYQDEMFRAVNNIRTLPAMTTPTEYSIAGDQLALFFYDERAVKFNYLLDHTELTREEARLVKAEYSTSNQRLALSALKAAVYLKSCWLTNPYNVERIAHHRDPVGLALGIHADKVFLRERAEGRRRIEGFAINLAKRVESFSRSGRFSRIMFSKAACNSIRSHVVYHTQMRQRIFFHRHEVDSDALKGLGRMEIFELKFYHRVLVVPPSTELKDLYDRIFNHDPTNLWAYYQLSGYLMSNGELDKLKRLGERAYLANPQDEKVLLDLGFFYLSEKMYGQAEEYCNQVLAVNPELDYAYELLARIYDAKKDYRAAVANARRALMLSPGSPLNQCNMACTLCENGEYDEAVHHFERAIQSFPGFLDEGKFADIAKWLDVLQKNGKLTPVLAGLTGIELPAPAHAEA